METLIACAGTRGLLLRMAVDDVKKVFKKKEVAALRKKRGKAGNSNVSQRGSSAKSIPTRE